MGCKQGLGKRILLVDDDRGVADVCVQMLRHHGYCVSTSLSGEDALDVFSRGQFDLVILDVGLPGIDGLSCAKELLRRKSDIKIVLSSGNCADLSRDKLQPGETFRLLQKPYTMSELIKTVGCMVGAC
jgi:DNA-binding response OmpR family regulator